jgi:hypothetical protein
MNMLTGLKIITQIGVFSIFLFLATLACHGELYRLRPAPSKLTSFYLTIAFGGVIGGIFVNLIAPWIFRGYWELHLSILLCWILILLLQWISRPSIFESRWGGELILALMIVLVLSGYLLLSQINTSLTGVLEIQRNFFGVTRVEQVELGQPPSTVYKLKHGSTSHGIQFINEDKSSLPTTYYGEKSGIGLVLTHLEKIGKPDNPQKNHKIGVIGLGVGTLATYGQSGDTYRFYEINPHIIDLALGQGDYFSYLADSPAEIEIISGDARLSLERELAIQDNQQFDILVLDAFSSDAIPIHLLTFQAFELYLEHLKPGGVLAVHISNRYLDLAPVVVDLGEQFHLESMRILSEQDDQVGSSSAEWVLLSSNRAFFDILEGQGLSSNLVDRGRETRTWTDDYNNLIPFLK